MHHWILFAIVFAVQNVSVLSQETRPDLGRIASDDHALASVEILYRVEGQFVTFHGDGRVLVQSTIPERQLLPTCKGRIPPEDVRRLLKTMMAAHFLDLPQKSYMIVNGDEGDWRKLQLHSISIKTAGGNASRTFSAGKYGGARQELPANFETVENSIVELKSTAISEGTRCTVSPPLWSEKNSPPSSR